MLGELLSVFWGDGFDFVWIDAEFGEMFSSGCPVRLAGLSIAAIVATIAVAGISLDGPMRYRADLLDFWLYHPDGLRAVDKIQRNLWLGLKYDIVRDVCFFRRAGSLAHSSGRYRRAFRRRLNPGAE